MISTTSWVEKEFSRANLGDRRLNRRLVFLVQHRAQAIQASIAQSCQGLSGMRSAYRFYDNERIHREQILAPHRQTTLSRMKAHRVVLAVQDTTQIDLTAHPHTQGVGYLQDLAHTGFLLHSTLMVTPKHLPLGLIQQQVWIRDPKDYGKRDKRHTRPTAEKESQKWLDSLQAVADLQPEVPDTRVVSVGDSEADAFDLFAQAQKLSVSFVVRACRDRLIMAEPEAHLWRALESQPVMGTYAVVLPRQADRPARTATLSLRWMPVELRSTLRRKEQSVVTGWAIQAQEDHPPAGQKPIAWRLITNVPTDTREQVEERLDWYSCRWVVEMFHRVLKSGCRIEERQFDDLANTQRFLAVDSVVAWHVLYLTLTGREMPQASCECLLESYEWQALYCFIHKTNTLPAQPPTLAQATHWIAQLGGFAGSKNVQPGTTVIWRGLQRLTDISQAWLVFHGDP
jgi:hypothetical protein